jgi:hypothetical protein
MSFIAIRIYATICTHTNCGSDFGPTTTAYSFLQNVTNANGKDEEKRNHSFGIPYQPVNRRVQKIVITSTR